MDIYPHRLCGSDIPFRDAGRKIRKIIEDNWDKEEIFVVYFEGRSVDSVSFFDEAFALLLRKGISIELLKERLRFPDINESDKMLLNFSLAKRLEELRVGPERGTRTK
jgi:hypothetical protein